MTKAHQKAFNKAYLKTLKSKDRRLVADKKNKIYIAMVPISTVIKNFKVFINTVEKDLKIGKHKK